MSRTGYTEVPVVRKPFQNDFSGFLAKARDPDHDGVGGKDGEELLRPLDHRDAIPPEQLLNPEVQDLGQAFGSVEVQVINRNAAPVVIDQDKGRARGRLHHAQAAHQPLEEAGLPGSQLTNARHHVSGAEAGAESLADPLGLLRAPAF